MKSLFKTVFIIIIFSTLTRFAGFLFRIWLSRSIGAESLGLYQISFSIFTVLLTLISSGIPMIVSRQTAKYYTNKDNNSANKTVTSALIISLVISAIICIIFFIFNKPLSFIFSDKRCMQILLALLPSLVFSSIYCTLRGSLWGQNKYLGVCSAELFEQLIRILICFFLLSGTFTITDGATSAAISLSLACIFSSIFVLVIYIKNGGKFKKPNNYKQVLKSSMPITGVRVSSSLIQPLIALIIPLRLISAGYTNSQALSLFGIAMGMTVPLLFIPLTLIGSLSMALIPDLGAATAINNKKHIEERVSNSLIFSIWVSCLFIPLYIGVGENIGLFFFNNVQSGVLLSNSAWIMLPLSLTNITSSILNAVGLEIKSFKNYILGAVLMILCIWFLPKYIGINALVYAMGSCFTVSSMLNIIMIKKRVSPNLKFMKKLCLLLCFIVPTASISWLLTNIFSYVFPLFINLALSCTIGTIFFFLLCLIFNVFKIHSVLVFIKENKYIKNIKLKKLKKKFKTK